MKLPIVLCMLSLLAFPLATAAQSPTVTPTPTGIPIITATPTATAGAPTASPTPTASATPTEQATAEPAPTQTPFVVTATPAPLPTATAPQPDSYEPNNSGGTAAPLNLPAQVEKLSFYPIGDRDYFRFVIKPSQAGLTLTLDTYAEVGIDTVISLFGGDGGAIASNDDASPTDPRSHLALPAQPGEYIVVIDNHATGRPDFKTYRLEIGLVAPQSGEPPPSAPQPDGDWDQYGGTNFTWETAAEIAVGEEVAGLTFGCPAWEAGRANCAVPDFFKLAVKAGSCYAAETSVTPGVDTNLIVYSDQRDGAAPLSGNDDRARGDFSSAAVFCAGYTGAAYLLVGQVGNIAPPPPISQRTYGLLVTIWAPAPPPTPTIVAPPAAQADPTIQAVPAPAAQEVPAPSDPITPPVDAPAAQEVPAPTPAELPVSGVLVEEISASQPAPTALPLVGATLGALACYDRNLNQACDVDEGIAGLAVYVALDSGELLAQAITDQNGRAQLTVRVAEDASLVISVPTFAAAQTVSARSSQIRPIVVKTVAAIPALIP